MRSLKFPVFIDPSVLIVTALLCLSRRHDGNVRKLASLQASSATDSFSERVEICSIGY